MYYIIYKKGDYLLISKKHNSSSFAEKCVTYDHLQQQRDVKKIYEKQKIWNKEAITERHDKIVAFILDKL